MSLLCKQLSLFAAGFLRAEEISEHHPEPGGHGPERPIYRVYVVLGEGSDTLQKAINIARVRRMMTLEDIKNDRVLVNENDWDMTPEEAVTLYLEWGNNWSHGRMVRSKNDVSYYFVLNTWGDRPKINLIQRNSEKAVELACLDLPEAFKSVFARDGNYKKGVYGLNREMKEWLQRELGGRYHRLDHHVAHRRSRGSQRDSDGSSS